jgi:hypothetical protein
VGLLVTHQRFLPEAARHVQHVELRRFGECGVGRQDQAPHIAHWRGRLGEDARRRVRQACQHLERPGEVDLVEPLVGEQADLQVDVPGSFAALTTTGPGPGRMAGLRLKSPQRIPQKAASRDTTRKLVN